MNYLISKEDSSEFKAMEGDIKELTSLKYKRTIDVNRADTDENIFSKHIVFFFLYILEKFIKILCL